MVRELPLELLGAPPEPSAVEVAVVVDMLEVVAATLDVLLGDVVVDDPSNEFVISMPFANAVPFSISAL